MEKVTERPIFWWLLILAAAVLIGGVYFWVGYKPVTTATPAPTAEPAPPAQPAIQHPIAESTPAEPLPALDQSDGVILDALAAVFGAQAVHEFLIPKEIVHRIVATIDNLPRSRAPLSVWPLKPVAGRFIVEQSGGAMAIGAANAARYAPYIGLAERVDTARLVALYVHFYPLFQTAYRELGYPSGYFNDRLIEVVDDLLDAPDVSAPVALVAPRAMYQYADPVIEASSAGQKIMIRVGRDNEARLKVKLRALRSALVGAKAGAP